jgi:acetyl/propionyl-CoA carboxylase alpha subunit
LGPRHNRDFLRRVVEHDDFERGAVDTGWLGRQGAALMGEPAPTAGEWAVAALALLMHDSSSRDFGELHGFANARPIPFPFDLVAGEAEQSVTLRCVDGGFEAQVGEQPVRMSAARWDREASELHVLCDGVRKRYVLHVDGERVQLDSGVRIDLRDRTRLPPGGEGGAGSGRIVSPMEGKLVELRVSEGGAVQRGDVLLVIEAMKLQNNVLADVDGTVARVGATMGDQVGIGQLLVEIEPS